MLSVGGNTAAKRACKKLLISLADFFVVAGDTEVATCHFTDKCFYICFRIIKHTACAIYMKPLTNSLWIFSHQLCNYLKYFHKMQYGVITNFF